MVGKLGESGTNRDSGADESWMHLRFVLLPPETVEHRLISPFLSVSTIRQLRCRCPCYATEIGIACFPSVSQKQQAEQPTDHLLFLHAPIV